MAWPGYNKPVWVKGITHGDSAGYVTFGRHPSHGGGGSWVDPDSVRLREDSEGDTSEIMMAWAACELGDALTEESEVTRFDIFKAGWEAARR